MTTFRFHSIKELGPSWTSLFDIQKRLMRYSRQLIPSNSIGSEDRDSRLQREDPVSGSRFPYVSSIPFPLFPDFSSD